MRRRQEHEREVVLRDRRKASGHSLAADAGGVAGGVLLPVLREDHLAGYPVRRERGFVDGSGRTGDDGGVCDFSPAAALPLLQAVAQQGRHLPRLFHRHLLRRLHDHLYDLFGEGPGFPVFCLSTNTPLRLEILYIAQFPSLTNSPRTYLGHVSCFTINAMAKSRQKTPTPTYDQPRNRFLPPSQFVVVTTSAFSMLFTKKSTVDSLSFPHSPSPGTPAAFRRGYRVQCVRRACGSEEAPPHASTR